MHHLRLQRALAVAALAACLAMTAFGLASLGLPGAELLPDRPNVLDVLIFSAIFMTFPAVGLAVAWKRPSHPVGWLFLVAGLGITVSVFSTEYAGRSVFIGPSLPGAALVGWVGGWSWFVVAGMALPLAVMLFPTGRFPGPRTVEAFAGRLRDEVELDAVGRTLLDVANRAVRPASASVWLRAGPWR
jgi:hypothetical protein